MLKDDLVRILLVDDDDVDRAAVRRALKNSGLNYELNEAYDSANALAAMLDDAYDCIILDYRMPDRDGVELFHEMARTHKSSAAVIFLTGEQNEDLAMSVMGSGAIDYLDKNELTPALLRRTIRYAQARQAFLSELTELGRIDALTGLPNRSVFDDVLGGAISQSGRTNSIVATILLDLDHFKHVNDTMGHPSGDALLLEVVKLLQKATRGSDTVIRLGGDEFVIVTPNLTNTNGAASLITKIGDAFKEPVWLNGKEVHISTSTGIALAPADGQTPEKILKSADMALYKAKAEGRGRFCFYDESLDIAAHKRQQLQEDLRLAIKQDEFELYYQPKVMSETGELIGVEALMRWKHPEHGFISPADFIPVAEDNRLILPIGEWVMREACSQMARWALLGVPIPNCSINISPIQLADRKLLPALDQILLETGADPRMLEIEVTETAIMGKAKEVAAVLNQARKRGMVVSVDDFGTGYSSLAHLKQLPLDKIKIDRSFVRNIETDTDDAQITSTMTGLAKGIGLQCIAEGAETQEQVDLLIGYGCKQIQGYFFSRPVPAEELTDRYASGGISAPKLAIAG
jgi:diguanylate cyclase (GGDEF)-like protein